jgi:EpsI family protein
MKISVISVRSWRRFGAVKTTHWYAAGGTAMRRLLHLQLSLVTGLVLLVFFSLQRLSPPSFSALQQRLQHFPIQVEAWAGTDGRLDEDIVTELNLDDWMLRQYRHPSGAFILLYLGFFEHLAPKKSHHSPQVCYPSWGWGLVQRGVQQIALPEGEPIVVNKLLVQKGLAQQLVLYWYQQGERILPENYSAWEVYGGRFAALLSILHRAPRANHHVLVRVSAPVLESVDVTLAHEIAFVQAAFPLLTRHFTRDISSR